MSLSYVKKAVFLLGILSLLSQSAHAKPGDHHKLTAVPRLFGRTAKNMVTFKDKQAAFEEWGSVGIALTDGLVSHNVISRVPDAQEADPLYGRRPSLARYVSITLTSGMVEAALTQYGHETWDNGGSRWVQHSPFAISAGAHIFGIAESEHTLHAICSRAGIVCQ